MRSDTLWPYYAVTVAYLAFGALVVFDRRGEIGSLFEAPGATPGRLPLNSLGDVLAGFFAPLAFLWLFAATQLQRTELKLQREELADTRAVLDEQRGELERAARESNEQTRIMQTTLESSRSKEIYEEHNLQLYFLARELVRIRGVLITVISASVSYNYQMPFVNRNINGITQTDPSTIDDFFDDFSNNVISLVTTSGPETALYLDEDYNQKIFEVLSIVIPALDRLTNAEGSYTNELVLARVRGMHLEDLRDRIKYLSQILRPGPAPDRRDGGGYLDPDRAL